MRLKLKRLIARLHHYWPTPLPQTTASFEVFMNDIFETHQLPESVIYRQSIPAIIMQSKNTDTRCSKQYFVKAVKNQVARDVAYEHLQKLRLLQKEMLAMEAAEKVLTTEALAHLSA